VLRKAVLGMLRRTNLRHAYIEPRLKIYVGPNHPHTAQLPPEVNPLPPVPRAKRGGFHFYWVDIMPIHIIRIKKRFNPKLTPSRLKYFGIMSYISIINV
jgi:hypothetical protein